MELAEPFLEALKTLRLDSYRNWQDSRAAIEPVIQQLLFQPLTEAPYASMRVTNGKEMRSTAITELLLSLGVPGATAKVVAQGMLLFRSNHDGNGAVLPGKRSWSESVNWMIWETIRKYGHMTYRGLERIHRDARKSYEGRPNDPDDGIEQTVDLLRRFPAIADYVYQETSLTGLVSFPPDASKAAPGSDAHFFATAVKAHLDAQWWSDTIFAAGLAVLAVIVTVASLGTLGPYAAAALGAGLGLAQGGALVIQRGAAVTEGRIAVRMGAMDPATLAQLEGSLQGAWGMLLIDMASGGILARFGGTRVLSQVVRGTLINAGAGALGVAVNPNTWKDENVVGLILKGALIGGAVGVVGSSVGAAVNRLALGKPVQIGVTKETGPLKTGSEVSVSFQREAKAVKGTVTKIEGDRLEIVAQGQKVTVRVDKAIQLRGRPDARADKPPAPALPDKAPHALGYVLDGASGQIKATTRARVSNEQMLRAGVHPDGPGALSGYPALQRATAALDTPHRIVDLDGQPAVQVLRPADGTVHPDDVIRMNGKDYYAAQVLRPHEGGVEVMPVTTRRNTTGVRGASFQPTPPGATDTQAVMRRIQAANGGQGPLLHPKIVHLREMGPLAGFAEHVIRERLVPNNLVAGAGPAYQRMVLSQYNDGATFIFVMHWPSGRFFSWPSGSKTVRLDGTPHGKSTLGSMRAHAAAAADMGRLTGIGGRVPRNRQPTPTPGSDGSVYSDYVAGTFQVYKGRLYWNDRSQSINGDISIHASLSRLTIFPDMYPLMKTRLHQAFGLPTSRVKLTPNTKYFKFNSRADP